MAPQTEIPVAANVLGTIGTVFWCVQLIPQIWTNYRTKSTTGLPGTMMFLWALCGVPFGVYAIAQNFNVPIQVQPQAFMTLCLVGWAQILIYGSKWPTWKATLLALIVACVFAGVEAALILTLRPLYEEGNETPVRVIGIIAAILLAAGLLPPYGEMYKRHGRVVGINWIFLSMDWSGAFFSLMAVVTQNTFDVLGGVLYIICAFLELGIFASHLIWLVRTRSIRKQLKKDGKTFDDLLGEYEKRGESWKWAERDLDLGRLKFWARKDKKREEEEGEVEIEQRDLEKQDVSNSAADAVEQQRDGALDSKMAMAEAQNQNGNAEDTDASTPTMVDGENRAVDRA
ncbi:PQ-loop-domain-containing protein [Neurospora crassa]|uniref:PQ loop repeat protein n=1 Tax=Neurospora crassa (strain ATCC 24698 / 74-OR23-1A / CBS 708.71 / DSM 1257 / FGSC 987) TaxID=367110 RepID=Q7SEP9_NEUCR|nr:PQ loop repeat protein [Neurospora crassa OR74A]EAA35291.3 PQ loop repeat protein [Neurospora crassa OR74A]KHE83979.1 PQ-loop-domain-containing protein [Neurospora crassa]|eukprot:XP_964527.3 PQ loop repeat protein [Neurospora crassa OR74A]